MGLTIHYTLSAPNANLGDIKRIVKALHDKAMELPFDEVGEIFDLQGDDCDPAKVDRASTLSCLSAHVDVGRGTGYGQMASVAPKRVIGFVIHPGEGCEAVEFTFATYPKTIKVAKYSSPPHYNKIYKVGKQGWETNGFTKTQYASDPTCGGIKNFLQCHIATVTLLEYGRTLDGLTVKIDDEGRYGESRYCDDLSVPYEQRTYPWHPPKHDIEALIKEVGSWNEMIAANFGAWKDAIQKAGGDPSDFVGSIQSFPDLEHLEAKGVEKSPEIRESLGLEA